ncbi:hypothetical protein [Azospirillum doebereinerae]|uniref:hypothetical protein n=1 Tax=Azospirillum doebereinerae TaxID=92933 RepID=UPI001FD1D902|nr:hypothetical protein [Azospirillum doebereinerae]
MGKRYRPEVGARVVGIQDAELAALAHRVDVGDLDLEEAVEQVDEPQEDVDRVGGRQAHAEHLLEDGAVEGRPIEEPDDMPHLIVESRQRHPGHDLPRVQVGGMERTDHAPGGAREQQLDRRSARRSAS